MSFIEIPGYRIIHPIDSGGMATVYLAEQTSLGREVAIKVMNNALSSNHGFAERFELEAKIASRLSHPNIVTIFDYGTIGSDTDKSTRTDHRSTDSESDKSASSHYLVMALIEGQDLKSLQPKLSLVTRLQIIQDIANALNYAHQQGVIHRDIKPQNILVQKDGSRALLADFGIAKARQNNNQLTQTGMTLGTPHYMSPEQALGKDIDHRADIYSLGIVLYFLLTGSVPYDGDSEVAIGIKHTSEPIPALPSMFACFQEIINTALAKQPEQRYQTAAEFANAVGKVSIDNIAALVQSINDTSEAKTQVINTRDKRLSSGHKNWITGIKTTLITACVTAIALLLVFWLLNMVFFNSPTAPSAPKKPPNPTPITGNLSNTTDNLRSHSTATKSSEPDNIETTATANSIGCRYSLINSWGSGWQGQIILSNPTTQDIQDWSIDFSLPSGTEINNSFVTRLLRHNDESITLTPHDWNKTLGAKSQLEIGFQGGGPAPTDLDDLHCIE